MLLLDVVLVPVEELLNRVTPKKKEALLDRFFTLRHLVYVRVSQGRSWLWYKRSWYTLGDQSLPVHILKPLMILDFLRTVKTQPI